MHPRSGGLVVPFKRMRGVVGLVYVPDCNQSDATRKHPCRDCHACQGCDDTRCAVCLRRKAPAAPCGGRKRGGPRRGRIELA
jgi:hypothetical protein